MFTRPSKPKQLTVDENMISKTIIVLSWKGCIPSDVSIIEYQLEFRKNDEYFKRRIVHAEDLPYQMTRLTAYTRYGLEWQQLIQQVPDPSLILLLIILVTVVKPFYSSYLYIIHSYMYRWLYRALVCICI